MIKYLKSVGVLLFLSTVCNGTVYANQEGRKTDVRVTQQNGTCTGVVKDATGETIIGASVVVKGSTNGTITGIDGDFSLSNVPKRKHDCHFIRRVSDAGNKVDGSAIEYYFE